MQLFAIWGESQSVTWNNAKSVYGAMVAKETVQRLGIMRGGLGATFGFNAILTISPQEVISDIMPAL